MLRYFWVMLLVFSVGRESHADVLRTDFVTCNTIKEPLVKNSPKFGESFTEVIKGLESAFELAVVKNTFAQLVYIKPFSQIKYEFIGDKLTTYSWVYSEEFMEDFSGSLDSVLKACVERVTNMYGPAQKASQLVHEWLFEELKITLSLDRVEGVISLSYTCQTKQSEKKDN